MKKEDKNPRSQLAAQFLKEKQQFKPGVLHPELEDQDFLSKLRPAGPLQTQAPEEKAKRPLQTQAPQEKKTQGNAALKAAPKPPK